MWSLIASNKRCLQKLGKTMIEQRKAKQEIKGLTDKTDKDASFQKDK